MCIYHNLAIGSFFDGQLGTFQLLSNINSVAMNILMKSFDKHLYATMFGMCHGVESLGHTICVFIMSRHCQTDVQSTGTNIQPQRQ